MSRARLTTQDMPTIHWSIKNFPPGLNIIAYDLSELSGRIRKFCRKAYWAVFSTAIYFLINLVSSLCQFAHPNASVWRLVFCLLMNPCIICWSFYNFWIGYRAVAYDNNLLRIFLLQEIPLAVLMLSAWIFDYLSFDGLMYAIDLWSNGIIFVSTFIVPFELVTLGLGLTMRALTIWDAYNWTILPENEVSLTGDGSVSAVKETELGKGVNKSCKDNESVITGEISNYVKQTGQAIIGKKFYDGNFTNKSYLGVESERASRKAGSARSKSGSIMKSQKSCRDKKISASKSPGRSPNFLEVSPNTQRSKLDSDLQNNGYGKRDIDWWKNSEGESPGQSPKRARFEKGSFNPGTPSNMNEMTPGTAQEKAGDLNSGRHIKFAVTPVERSPGDQGKFSPKTDGRKKKQTGKGKV